MRIPALTCCLALAAALPAAAQGRLSPEEVVQITAVPDVDHVRPGQSFHVALLFKIRPGWHIYWQNPGSLGAPPEVELHLPDGFKAGAIRWSRPEAILSQGAVSYGYEHKTVLFLPVTAPAELPDAAVDLAADVRFTVCKDVCMRGRDVKELSLPIGKPADTDKDGEARKEVLAFKRALPRPIADLKGASAKFDGKTLVVEGPAGDHAEVSFFPLETIGVGFGKAKTAVKDGRFRVEAPVKLRRELTLPGEKLSVAGLVALGKKALDPSYRIAIPLK